MNKIIQKIMLILTYPVGMLVVVCKGIDDWMRSTSK